MLMHSRYGRKKRKRRDAERPRDEGSQKDLVRKYLLAKNDIQKQLR
jgi:hypothetical protein